jgi:DNA-binding GntR family transcriptional regulator
MSSNNHLVLKRLYEDIVVGAFSFGTKLGEEQLVARYGVKRHVLREAFGQLEELGLVEHVPNRGVFVREPSPSEVRELFEIRELLEIHAAKSMTLPVSPEFINALREVQARHSAAARAAQYREVLHLNTEFHRIQYAACGNETLMSAIEGYAVRTHLISAMKFGDATTMEIVIGQHEEIIDAMSGDDRDRLALAIRSHFDLARIDQYEQQYLIRHGEDSQSAKANRPRHRIGVAAVS